MRPWSLVCTLLPLFMSSVPVRCPIFLCRRRPDQQTRLHPITDQLDPELSTHALRIRKLSLKMEEEAVKLEQERERGAEQRRGCRGVGRCCTPAAAAPNVTPRWRRPGALLGRAAHCSPAPNHSLMYARAPFSTMILSALSTSYTCTGGGWVGGWVFQNWWLAQAGRWSSGKMVTWAGQHAREGT